MKSIRSRIIYIILGVLILGISTVFAYSYLAQNVGYTPTDTEWDVENTKEALDDLRDKFGRESKLITNISFTPVAFNRYIRVTINTTIQNSSDISAYHVYVTDKENSNDIKSYISKDNVIDATGLSVSTSYYVYVVAYDKYDHYKESSIQLVSTLLNPENLVPILTSNTSGGGNAFATYTANGRSPWEAFDGIIDPPSAFGNRPGYMISSTQSNQIGYDFGAGNEKIVSMVVYYGHPGDGNARYTSFTLQYSDNGSSWTDVQTYTPRNPTSYSTIADLREEFEVDSPMTSHRYWRINATNAGHSWAGLLELQFWGY